MKAAIIGSKVENGNLDLYSKIKTNLENKGLQVDFSFFAKTLDDDFKDLESSHARNQKLLKNCDFLVAEVTTFSSGIGYLIANTLNLKKPVIVLFNSKIGKLAPNAIKSSAIKSKLLKYVEYKTDEELDKILVDYVEEVKQKLDTKFILIISSQIDRYLEWASNDKRMHKAQIVRNAVEDMMGRDKEWKSFKAGQ